MNKTQFKNLHYAHQELTNNIHPNKENPLRILTQTWMDLNSITTPHKLQQYCTPILPPRTTIDELGFATLFNLFAKRRAQELRNKEIEKKFDFIKPLPSMWSPSKTTTARPRLMFYSLTGTPPWLFVYNIILHKDFFDIR